MAERDDENPMERAFAAGVRDGHEFTASDTLPQSVMLWNAMGPLQVAAVRKGEDVGLDVRVGASGPWARWWLTTEQAKQIALALEGATPDV